MKTKTFLTLLLIAVAISTQAQQIKVVEQPPAMFANTRAVEINKVTLSDSETVLDIDAYYQPGYWIKIVSDAYLQADGKKYMIRRGEGIDLDSLFWMPKSGEASFKLVFEPLPKNTRSFDFIESDCEDCFKVYGIDLVNKRLKLPAIPQEYTQKHTPETDFEVTWKKGDAIVSGQLLGYRPSLGDVTAYYINPITGVETETPVKVDAGGNFKTAVNIVSPTNLYLRSKVATVPIKVAPGKESKVLINLSELYRKGSRLFKNSEPYGKEYYYAGYLASLNTELANEGISRFAIMEYVDSVAGMNADAYKSFMAERYNINVAHNNSLNIQPLAKEIINAEQVFEFYQSMEMMDYSLMQAYMKKNNLSREEAQKTFTPPTRPEDFTDYYRMIPYNEPALLLVPNISHRIEMLGYSRGILNDRFEVLRYLASHKNVSSEDQDFFKAFLSAQEKHEEFKDAASLNEIFGKYKDLSEKYMNDRMGAGYLSKVWNTDNAFLLNLIKSMKIASGLQDFNPLTDEQKKEIAVFASVIQQALIDENTKLLAKIEENKKKTGYTVLATPQTEDEKLFVEMMKPFKGKVVLVDVWATWCGPCRAAHKEMEPLKAQFADKEVVFLYLAGEDSPGNTWKNMIADINGSHYRLNQAQYDYLSKSLNVRGVPTYIILDKEGNHSYYSTGFPGVSAMKTELEKALKKN